MESKLNDVEPLEKTEEEFSPHELIEKRKHLLVQQEHDAYMQQTPHDTTLAILMNDLFRHNSRLHQLLEQVDAQTSDALDKLSLRLRVSPELNKTSREIRTLGDYFQRVQGLRDKQESEWS